jgi:hypothetical protein
MCPHCRTVGQVHAEDVNVKCGVSGGKATAAVFTGGASMLVTGLSPQAACDSGDVPQLPDDVAHHLRSGTRSDTDRIILERLV